MKVPDTVLEGREVSFRFMGRDVKGQCQVETRNTLTVGEKVYPKKVLSSFSVQGHPVPVERLMGASLVDRLKREA
ncbi:MAG: hypothetical protein ACP5UI_00570 [Thermoprotei archaeon]|nr:hypothetical protein [TACK group archaeon]